MNTHPRADERGYTGPIRMVAAGFALIILGRLLRVGDDGITAADLGDS